jgi:hypothetical protein
VGELILAVLEPLLEGAMELFLLGLCEVILAGWHVLQASVGQMFS